MKWDGDCNNDENDNDVYDVYIKHKWFNVYTKQIGKFFTNRNW